MLNTFNKWNLIITWIYPLSYQQDYYMLARESQPEFLFATGIPGGG